MGSRFEHCCECEQHTGRAGRADDSLYIGNFGPYCEDCYPDAITEIAEGYEDAKYRYTTLLTAVREMREAECRPYAWTMGHPQWDERIEKTARVDQLLQEQSQ